MSRILKTRVKDSDDLFGWIGLALVVIASLILDKDTAPRKWHAAIMWTFVAFLSLLRFGRKERGLPLFWIFWGICLALHLFAMWLIFGQLLPRLLLGTLYVVPVGFVEGLFLFGMFARLQRKLTLQSHRRTRPGTK
jgi:hypothetical protein